MNINESNNWHTSDLALASALSALGYELIRLEKTNSRKMFFLFNDSPELEKSISDFWRDELKVSPRLYFEAIKTMKSRIYSEQ